MFWFLAILYIAVGSAATLFYKLECLKMYDKWHAHDDDTMVAIAAGIFWPVVALFAFAILFAKKYANENKIGEKYGKYQHRLWSFWRKSQIRNYLQEQV